ncbi:hypothetical protein [Marinibactrum halimedae]|uniref:Uncharacterized protein n=1 Tax=Marinibactrum halimedae TaxID=1444977 RepID=A0AA37T6F1_9GAMM|nr:hypothetical protein [Marinibactrum halimedae]MCD9461004.1 hypothetical protein [Marinibactrum halimedae]GLS27810.1 hypothetical protein GCM10007877_35290 [Marinibactrum halimedae]
MALYTIVFDNRRYLSAIWDSEQIIALSNNELDHRIDMNGAPIRHADTFKEPLRVSFEKRFEGDEKLIKSDITVQEGRFYLNEKAYDVLYNLLKDDGEFLPLIDDSGNSGYVFTPLKVAEDNNALDTNLSKKNEWGDVENLAFHVDKVKDWAVFRAEFNAYMTPQCNQVVKDAIENAQLTGVFFTTDLGNGYSNQFDEEIINGH